MNNALGIICDYLLKLTSLVSAQHYLMLHQGWCSHLSYLFLIQTDAYSHYSKTDEILLCQNMSSSVILKRAVLNIFNVFKRLWPLQLKMISCNCEGLSTFSIFGAFVCFVVCFVFVTGYHIAFIICKLPHYKCIYIYMHSALNIT